MDDYQRGGALLTALVNSGPEVQSRGDQIPDAAGLERFLAEHGLPVDGRRLGPADVAQAHRLRSALREVVTAPTEAEMAERAGELASAVGIGPVLGADEHGAWHWQVRARPGASPVDEAALLAATSVLAVLRALGAARFRHCAAPECAGVFVDTSRGGRRRYCEPDLCGNRINVAAYRARRRARPTSTG